MDDNARARAFADLHCKGDPVILYNIWDAGSARAVMKAGAKALATGSASVAEAQGYGDGEAIPLDAVLANLSRIVSVAGGTPVTLDFEGAYARAPEEVAGNVARVIAAGAVGINFEDQIVGGEGLYGIEAQCARIAAIRKAADEAGVALFINARTDIFLKAARAAHSQEHVGQAIERGTAYAQAGASGFFVPGLIDPTLIGMVTKAVTLPVNILMMQGAPDVAALRKLNVARLSYGPYPFRDTMKVLQGMAEQALSS